MLYTGNPQAHKDDIEALGARAIPRPCPQILNDWTAQQPQIDKRNRERQHMLAMEKRFVTANFPFRLFTTILGMTFTTAMCFYEYFYAKYDGTFVEFVHELCYDGMTNTLDATHARPVDPAIPNPADPADPAGCPSPFGSPASAAKRHRVCRVSDIKGWKGCAQPVCSVCGKHTTRCCSICSSADAIFTVCDPVARPDCMQSHRAEPENPNYRKRVSTGATGKRKATMPPGGTTPAPPPGRGGGGSGSRSGGSAAWSDLPHGGPRGGGRDRS